MLKTASIRERQVFTYWLDNQVLKKRGITAVAFLRMCNRGEVPGLEPIEAGPPDEGEQDRPF